MEMLRPELPTTKHFVKRLIAAYGLLAVARAEQQEKGAKAANKKAEQQEKNEKENKCMTFTFLIEACKMPLFDSLFSFPLSAPNRRRN